MNLKIGGTAYCCYNAQGQRIKGEKEVVVVGIHQRMGAYAIQFDSGAIGVIDEKNLRSKSRFKEMEEKNEARDLKEYERLKKKYENS